MRISDWSSDVCSSDLFAASSPGSPTTIAGECGAMSKAGDRILASVREARAWARGEPVEGFRVHVPDSIDVAAIRDRAGLSQERFAAQIGVPVATLRNWESGRRRPDEIGGAHV